MLFKPRKGVLVGEHPFLVFIFYLIIKIETPESLQTGATGAEAPKHALRERGELEKTCVPLLAPAQARRPGAFSRPAWCWRRP
jgi:hypothetical protein